MSQTCTKLSKKWKSTKAENCSEVVQLVAQRTLTPLILVRVQASEPNFSLTKIKAVEPKFRGFSFQVGVPWRFSG